MRHTPWQHPSADKYIGYSLLINLSLFLTTNLSVEVDILSIFIAVHPRVSVQLAIVNGASSFLDIHLLHILVDGSLVGEDEGGFF